MYKIKQIKKIKECGFLKLIKSYIFNKTESIKRSIMLSTTSIDKDVLIDKTKKKPTIKVKFK